MSPKFCFLCAFVSLMYNFALGFTWPAYIRTHTSDWGCKEAKSYTDFIEETGNPRDENAQNQTSRHPSRPRSA